MTQHYWYLPEGKAVEATSREEAAKKLVQGPPVLAIGTYATGSTVGAGRMVTGRISSTYPGDMDCTYKIGSTWVLNRTLQALDGPPEWAVGPDGKTLLHCGNPMTAEAVLAILKRRKA